MPIYEYRCEPCEQAFEAFLATSTDQATCPRCNGTELTRLMSVFASAGKGGGAPAPAGPAPKKTGGCGGGCACH